jgi:hypothetical protein
MQDGFFQNCSRLIREGPLPELDSPSGRHLVQHQPEREQVGARVQAPLIAYVRELGLATELAK